jgi:hypothetical protein
VIRQVPIVDESSARAAVTEVTAEHQRDNANTTAPPALPAGHLHAPKNIVTINDAVVLISGESVNSSLGTQGRARGRFPHSRGSR